MEEFLTHAFSSMPIFPLLLIIAAAFLVLAKGADILVGEAVKLSEKWGVPRMIIGATVVSLGTTLPEVSVSVAAAIGGNAGLALGNGVGSIICDTGLILGLAALIAPLPIPQKIIKRQGNIQLGAALLLIVASLIFSKGNVFAYGSHLPQLTGFIFVALLVLYIASSIFFAKSDVKSGAVSAVKAADEASVLLLLKLAASIAAVILASKTVIPAAMELAARARIPESVVGATLVALGTSLPELVTAIASARKGVGDIAVGNIVGADILNVLSVIGISLAVTPGGLAVDKDFFTLFYPGMLGVIVVFRLCVHFSKGKPLGKGSGLLLLGSYIIITVASYLQA